MYSKKQNTLIGDVYRSISQVTNKTIPFYFYMLGIAIGMILDLSLLFVPKFIHALIAMPFKQETAKKIKGIFVISALIEDKDYEEKMANEMWLAAGCSGLVSAIGYGIGGLISETINVVLTVIALPFVRLALWVKERSIRKTVNKDPTVHDITSEFVEKNQVIKMVRKKSLMDNYLLMLDLRNHCKIKMVNQIMKISN